MASSGTRPEPPLVVIVGPTASGKTGLAIRLAREFNGEIISADSRAVYRGLDIGTAKPTKEEQQGVPHWGIDILNPNESYSAADFQVYAKQKITEIRARGCLPLLVGGTGLYVDAIVYDFSFASKVDGKRRRILEDKTIEELWKHCDENNILLPENYKNKRYVISAIIRSGTKPHRRHKLPKNVIIVGITTNKNELRKRIEDRADSIVTDDTVDETTTVVTRYGWENEAMTGNIYRLLRRYLAGEVTKDELKRLFVVSDWRLAKRQLTWLRRNPDIVWHTLDEAYTYCARAISEMNKS